MNNIDAKTKLYCIIGDHVEHSLSPVMHNVAFTLLGINAVYLGLQVKKNKLEETIAALRALNVKGINVTAPHKIEVMKYLDRIENTAKMIGAVNTIVNDDGKLVGYNTDIDGALRVIKNKMKNLKNKKALIIGAGGIARAIGFGLAKESAKITILNRTKEKAEELATMLKRLAKIDINFYELNEKNLSLLRHADLLCNCTSVGAHGNSSIVPKKILRKGLVVFDAVYQNNGSTLIKDAISAGCIVIRGEDLLVQQGIATLKLWTGKKPDTEILLNIVKEKLSKNNLRGQKQNIFLIGFMGSGKSTIGKKLAKKLNINFIDTDKEIEKIAGKPIKQIFAESGEEAFREIETDIVNLASKKENCVIAVGGGAVLNYINILRMRKLGVVVLLRTSPNLIVKRLKNDKKRPLLGLNEKQRLARTKELLKFREPFYDLAKDFEVDCDGKDVNRVVNEIITSLGVRK